MTFAALCRRATSLGLAVRGAFHPEPREFDQLLPAARIGTMVLLGFTGSEQWGRYQSCPEASDGLPHPLDRWSRRVIGALASELGGVGLYADGTPPQLPFQRLALRSEPVHQSPIGLLIHPEWGLWHAYRGALALPGRIELPTVAPSVHPCSSCALKPCLSSCPVQAFRPGSFDVEACVDFVMSAAGSDCRERGCRARRSCPVGTVYRYVQDQARFHMRGCLRSVRD
jgi:ferredoxin-like protein FixX